MSYNDTKESKLVDAEPVEPNTRDVEEGGCIPKDIKNDEAEDVAQRDKPQHQELQKESIMATINCKFLMGLDENIALRLGHTEWLQSLFRTLMLWVKKRY